MRRYVGVRKSCVNIRIVYTYLMCPHGHTHARGNIVSPSILPNYLGMLILPDAHEDVPSFVSVLFFALLIRSPRLGPLIVSVDM